MGRWHARTSLALVTVAVLLGAVPAPGALAQGAPDAILVLNQERIFTESAYGLRVQSEFEAANVALSSENREIEARLSEEELQLTADRETLPLDEFRTLAADFDERVSAIRVAQDAKGRQLAQQAEEARLRFFEIAFPVLLEIARERNAAAILDSRSVLLSAEAADITTIALQRIDDAIGNGGDGSLLELDVPVDPSPRPITDPPIENQPEQ